MEPQLNTFLDELSRLDATGWRTVWRNAPAAADWDAAWEFALRLDDGVALRAMRAAALAGAPLGVQALAGAAAVALAHSDALPGSVYETLLAPFADRGRRLTLSA